jgi:REP element-mobilizing transposase RayT
MVRGIERRAIFRDDTDRAAFVARLADLVSSTGLSVYAWALLSNHAHLLVRTGRRSLPRVMRSLLTGYAGAFNRRHKRQGHLFQNRYKSIVVEEEPYLLELVRYLHLNPLRAGTVTTLRALDRYPWAGHSALLGTVPRPWQATRTILEHFGPSLRRASKAYQAFVAAGRAQGRRPELQGGGLVRSLGGWAAVAHLRRGREAYVGDERILGSSTFVEALQRDLPPSRAGRREVWSMEAIVQRVCTRLGMDPARLQHGGRKPPVSRAREGIAYLSIEVLGHSGRALAPLLGIRPVSVYAAARRGLADRRTWDVLLARK